MNESIWLSDKAHPFLTDVGTTQEDRFRTTLDPDQAPVDSRDTEDLLVYIYDLARYIIHHDDEMQIGDWQVFFEESAPFLVARFERWDLSLIMDELNQLLASAQSYPQPMRLEQLVHYIHSELILRIHQWYVAFQLVDEELTQLTGRMLIRKIVDEVHRFIDLTKYLDVEFDIKVPNYFPLLEVDEWKLSIEKICEVVSAPLPRGAREAGNLLFFATQFEEIAQDILTAIRGLQQTFNQSSDLLATALMPENPAYQGYHEPHLGLMFTFLQLFQRFRDELNGLTEKHLSYFYEQVLQIARRPATPDRAHLVLDIQKQLERYKLDQGQKVLGGKDPEGKDIQYTLNDEIVIDQAQIVEVKTLFVNRLPDPANLGQTYIEGLYMAPNAMMADGKEETFAEEGLSWPTLGAKESKFFLPDQAHPQPYDAARIGIAIASPILYLQGGDRTITFTFTNVFTQEEITPFSTMENLWFSMDQSETPLFYVKLSGDGEWIIPDSITATFGLPQTEEEGENDETPQNTSSLERELKVTIILTADQGSVLPFDAEKLGEPFPTQDPVAVIELNPAAKFNLAVNGSDAEGEEENFTEISDLSPYHYLKDFELSSYQIDVDVCDLKSFIVQNDENIQDIGKEIMPFGSQPNVPDYSVVNPHVTNVDPIPREGSNFFVGSGEVFGKHWDMVKLKINWKNLPSDFEDHYAGYIKGGISKEKFQVKAYELFNGAWSHIAYPEATENEEFPLFNSIEAGEHENEVMDESYPYQFEIVKTDLDYTAPTRINPDLTEFGAETRWGFLRLALYEQDFLHKDFSLVMGRQLMAIGQYANKELVVGAVFSDDAGIKVIGEDTAVAIAKDELIVTVQSFFNQFIEQYNNLKDEVPNAEGLEELTGEQTVALMQALEDLPRNIDINLENILSGIFGRNIFNLGGILEGIDNFFDDLFGGGNDGDGDQDDDEGGQANPDQGVLLPNEPYTPMIQGIALDYTATAQQNDITHYHLGAYSQTFSEVASPPGVGDNAEGKPKLLPHYEEEGYLFIRLKHLNSKNLLNLFVQMAEATADTEIPPAEVEWQYLVADIWKPLEPVKHILSDGTQGLTRSGIIQVDVPNDISTGDHSLLNPDGYWIRATVNENVAAICETIGLHTQAVQVTREITETQDTTNIAEGIPAGTISKLANLDANVKGINQFYQSFGGRASESQAQMPYYVRVSEHLRHKGRGINVFDYEHLVLENFPEIRAVKCITHSLALSAHTYGYDADWAPGFITLALIPDLNRLKAASELEPRVPLSLINEIRDFLLPRISPFVRLKIMNPRYEPINLTVNIQFRRGKPSAFYAKELEEELTCLLAPWKTGEADKLNFSRTVSPSKIIGFIESRDYVDYIADMPEPPYNAHTTQDGTSSRTLTPLKGLTPRSILTSGTILIQDAEEVASSNTSDS